jgi:hypothetical protein
MPTLGRKRSPESPARGRLRARPVDPAVKSRKELESEVANLVDAIGKRLLSPTLAKRLQDAEAELAALSAPCTVIRVDDVLRGSRRLWRGIDA